jgi:transposase-like protein
VFLDCDRGEPLHDGDEELPAVAFAGESAVSARLHNRAENSHLPFRRREGAMLRFRRMRSLQKFASVHASVTNHFNSERSLSSRPLFKANRAAALAEWQGLCAG